MKPGIIITIISPIGRLNNYACSFHEHGIDAHVTLYATLPDGGALAYFLSELKAVGRVPEWVIGCTKKEAHGTGLKRRLRMPGAGRKATDAPVVALNTWVRPEVRTKILAAAKRSNRSIGEEVASRF